jgi:hypothetical protein
MAGLTHIKRSPSHEIHDAETLETLKKIERHLDKQTKALEKIGANLNGAHINLELLAITIANHINGGGF